MQGRDEQKYFGHVQWLVHGLKSQVVINDIVIAMGLHSIKVLQIATMASQLYELDNEMPLEAPPGFGSAPPLAINGDKAWIAAGRLLLFWVLLVCWTTIQP